MLEERRHDELSTAELIKKFTEQSRELIREEIRLARVELAQKGKRAGRGVGMFGGAGVMALYGGGVLVAALVLLLALALPDWVAALIVGVALMAVAGILALAGRKETRRALPPVPKNTLDRVARDVEEVKEAARR